MSQNDFPRMLFKAPGPHEYHGVKCDHLIVASAAEQERAEADGWKLTTREAQEAHEAASHVATGGTDEAATDAPPTRAELEQKAEELGITVDRRWGDKRLAAEIAAALGE